MGGDAHEEGKHDPHDAAQAKKREWLQGSCKAAFEGVGEQGDDRGLGKAMKKPQDRKSKGEAEAQSADDGVAPATTGRKPHKILEIGRHGSHDQR